MGTEYIIIHYNCMSGLLAVALTRGTSPSGDVALHASKLLTLRCQGDGLDEGTVGVCRLGQPHHSNVIGETKETTIGPVRVLK